MRMGLIRTLRVAHRAAGRLLPSRAFSLRFPEIPGRVHIDDQMLQSHASRHVRHYLEDGLSAIANLEASLQAAGRSFRDVEACLDLPSGYGRVTRHLVGLVGATRVTACDLDRQAVRFCAAEFGVRALRAHRDPGRLAFPDTYDLVFVGSLLTHLTPAAGLRFLQVITTSRRPGGLLVFSTQGESCLEHLDWYGSRFAAAEDVFRDGVRRAGAWFVPYAGTPDYGITIHAHGFLRDALTQAHGAELAPVRFVERGWDRHQDVWTYQRQRRGG